jgi:hypothetical protein
MGLRSGGNPVCEWRGADARTAASPLGTRPGRAQTRLMLLVLLIFLAGTVACAGLARARDRFEPIPVNPLDARQERP